MDGILLVIIILLLLGTLLMVGLVLGVRIPGISSSQDSAKANLRNIVAAQRATTSGSASGTDSNKGSIFSTAEESSVKKVTSSRLTLKKKLKYAQWKIPPLVYWCCAAGVSLFCFSICWLKFNIIFQLLALFLSGPIFMGWMLTLRIDRRFKKFDADYPSFLLSVVSLIKTGMNVMTALDAAAKALDESSLVRAEVEMMIERLRYGVSEDKSIGSFGEDVFHPEIELFVQALLLSRRVGGTLSDTLERLAKQVRRRQFFRSSAQASVAMQRGSIWFIIAILVGIELYLLVIYPEAVTTAIKDDVGWQVWQFSILVIMAGVFWVRQVTKIRV